MESHTRYGLNKEYVLWFGRKKVFRILAIYGADLQAAPFFEAFCGYKTIDNTTHNKC